MCVGVSHLRPGDLGWKMTDGDHVPVMTDLPPASDALLQLIRCNCSTDCSTASCTCYNNKCVCSPACGQCRVSVCSNSVLGDASDDEEDDE